MENSTKAILMAAGVLFALLTLSLVTVMIGNIQTISEAENSKQQTKELQEWNAQWEAYNKEIMYGSEVITVINKAAQSNYEGYEVKITVKKENGTTIISRELSSYLQQNELSIFTCEKISYNEETGRVNEMIFRNTGK